MNMLWCCVDSCMLICYFEGFRLREIFMFEFVEVGYSIDKDIYEKVVIELCEVLFEV